MNIIKTTLVTLCLLSVQVFSQNGCQDSFKAKYNSGDYKGAIQISSNCNEIDKNPELRYFKARSFMFLKNYESALSNYRALLATDIKNVDYLNGLGAAFYMLDQNDSALVYYSKTLKYDPKRF